MDDGGASNQQALLDRKNSRLQFLWLRVRENYRRTLLIGNDTEVNGRLIFEGPRCKTLRTVDSRGWFGAEIAA